MGQANPVAVLSGELNHRKHLQKPPRMDPEGHGGTNGVLRTPTRHASLRGELFHIYFVLCNVDVK